MEVFLVKSDIVIIVEVAFPVLGSISGTAMNSALGLPSYILSSRPMTSWTLQRVAMWISFAFFFLRDLRSVVYSPYSLSRRSIDNASSIPETKSSTYRNPSHRVTPVSDPLIGLQVSVLKGCHLPRLIVSSFALFPSNITSGNTSLQQYSLLVIILRTAS